PPTTLSTLSLHDALPISHQLAADHEPQAGAAAAPAAVADLLEGPEDARELGFAHADAAVLHLEAQPRRRNAAHPQPDLAAVGELDRKSTRLNSSHQIISY